MAHSQKWVNWLFTTHPHLFGDLRADVRLWTTGGTFATGVFVLAAWAIILLDVAFVRFGRQDILNA